MLLTRRGGLAELELLRRRQEALVREALELREEEKLEENILLLGKQLNCLRRRDAGLITQLQELDKQISDLRLDTEASRDQLETDSRPSSGFYELSDGASCSLSNSSNSVFSECFCSMVDADGQHATTDEPGGCLECDGLVRGLCDDVSGTIRRSLSAPPPSGLDHAPSDSQSRFLCDLRNGGDVYRYPSPLHAVAVQSPAYILMLSQAESENPPLPVSAPFVPQSSSWTPPSSSSSSSQKRLDSYILSLLQRRALPLRANRPRTSISTEPSKSVLRQLSRPPSGSGPGNLRGSELKPTWMSSESKGEEPKTQNGVTMSSSDSSQNQNKGSEISCIFTNKNVNVRRPSAEDAKPPSCFPSDQTPPLRPPSDSCRSLESNSLDEAKNHIKLGKLCRRKVKSHLTTKTSRTSGLNEPPDRKRNKCLHTSQKSQLLDHGGSAHIKVSRRVAGTCSSRVRRVPASIPEGRVLDQQATSTLSRVRSGASRHHHHGNHHDQVVSKPKHKRSDHRRIADVPSEEAFRLARRRQRRELPSPYSITAGSDSEYSAECASLFHSTIVDTSEDDRSNYTTNRFGDGESSADDYEDVSAEEESGGGGAGTGAGGRGRGQVGTPGSRGAGQEVSPSGVKNTMKIKASHNLKKKILRFRSGSLKLMTTV